MVSTLPQPKVEQRSVKESLTAAGTGAAIMAATAAVNSAISMRELRAPDVDNVKSFVWRDGAIDGRKGKVDEYGLPLVYDKDLIEQYWRGQNNALTSRWTEFLSVSVPFITRVLTIVIGQGAGELKAQSGSLARDARERMEKLGPTYIKLGQMMSVRPDVLPDDALKELQILQDNVKAFDTSVAISQIEAELGGPLSEFFSEISEKPVAAASLAQVYRAKLISTGKYVAVKVQRPRVLETVSKDLYVLRRAAEVYQGLIERFAPQQRTNYVALLNEWSVGFYTELDFLNEAANQQKLRDLMIENKVDSIYIPEVNHELSTRRVLVSEWIDGRKLSDCSPMEINSLIGAAQEAFLTQLLQVGMIHSDPHPGNLMFMDVPRGPATLALLDFGLVAKVKQEDMDVMVSAIIHLANRDYPSLVDDFIRLEILPSDCDRAKVVPLMDKALTPYVKGGGAGKYEEELKKMYGMDGSLKGTTGGFQAMTQDALTVLNDIPFSIPAYFALLARAIVTLEGIALTGDPSYGIIMEAYPFVARKLLREDRPEIQKALQQVLYASKNGGGSGGLSTTRLSVLLQSALGVISRNSGAAIDFDTFNGDLSVKNAVKLLLSDKGQSLRNLLVEESVSIGDVLLRQNTRKTFMSLLARVPRPPFFGNLLPRPETLPVPFFVPSASASGATLVSQQSLQTGRSAFSPVLVTPTQLLDCVAPKLSREEELYAIALTDASSQFLGSDARVLINGDVVQDPMAALRLLLRLVETGAAGVGGQLPGFSQLGPLGATISSLWSLVGGGGLGSRVGGGG